MAGKIVPALLLMGNGSGSGCGIGSGSGIGSGIGSGCGSGSGSGIGTAVAAVEMVMAAYDRLLVSGVGILDMLSISCVCPIR